MGEGVKDVIKNNQRDLRADTKRACIATVEKCVLYYIVLDHRQKKK